MLYHNGLFDEWKLCFFMHFLFCSINSFIQQTTISCIFSRCWFREGNVYNRPYSNLIKIETLFLIFNSFLLYYYVEEDELTLQLLCDYLISVEMIMIFEKFKNIIIKMWTFIFLYKGNTKCVKDLFLS